MTDQEIFDKVATHLLTQGKRSGYFTDGENFRCLYRGPEGTSCAIGCLIPDELYDPEMEDQNVFELKCGDRFAGVADFLGLQQHTRAMLLSILQNAHDEHFETIDTLKNNLRNIAERKNFNTEVLDT